MNAGCPLCEAVGGRLVFEHPQFRVIHADEPGFPAFYRLVWRDHVREFSDLAPTLRALCMEAVALIETCLREQLAPAKINLATLGNVVPHLHWHVIARFEWDAHFPAPVWATAQRERDVAREAEIALRLAALESLMVERLRSL
ncbi:HIT family protein [Variovorax dokdonensis]|uniref:HIT family protein n=1 Tax=Variovorax dokdonensis TaxID=344883 RepID=A0ABT7N6X3_9BURK|nr:HIT family protein [Variovorax dokdonensis]MDM0043696.1 HIT family protein [Variovorax dokdonensis]